MWCSSYEKSWAAKMWTLISLHWFTVCLNGGEGGGGEKGVEGRGKSMGVIYVNLFECCFQFISISWNWAK